MWKLPCELVLIAIIIYHNRITGKRVHWRAFLFSIHIKTSTDMNFPCVPALELDGARLVLAMQLLDPNLVSKATYNPFRK